MIAAGYNLHLYCDCRDCADYEGRVENHPGFGEYYGETWLEVARQAAVDGWSINKERTLCYAPGHQSKKIQNDKSTT